MKTELKRGLPQALAARLREQLAAGKFADGLPGLRLLAADAGVSVPTVAGALRLLAAEGLLVAGGERRRWRVVSTRRPPRVHGRSGASEGPAAHGSGRLLFLSSHSFSSGNLPGIEVFAELVGEVSHAGWETFHRVIPFDGARKARESWRRILDMTEPDAVVVLVGTPLMAAWLKAMGMRCLFIGGNAGDTGVPTLATRISTMVAQAVRRLLASGHRRILMPFCGRQDKFTRNCVKCAREAIETAGAAADSFVAVETPYIGPDVIVNLLRKYWPLHKPDALLTIDWREFVAASSYLRTEGLEIPRDVSAIILSQDASMDWHLPPISHFEIPTKAIAKMAAQWVQTGKLPKSRPNSSVLVPPRWVGGGSVANRNRRNRK